MKAVVWKGPYNLSLEETAKPSPARGEVLIKTKAVGVCGSDLDIYEGRFKQAHAPMIIGHEGGGVVDALGADAAGVESGDRVMVECILHCGKCEYCRTGRYGLCDNGRVMGMVDADGEYAEYFTAPVKNCYSLPDEISWPEAGMIDTLAGPVHALKGVHPVKGKTVAVFGPGPAGLFFCRLAKLQGASKVYLVGTRDERLKLGRPYGADISLNASNVDAPAAILSDTDGRGVHLAIEAAGSEKALNDSINVLRKAGDLLIYGVFGSGPVTVDIQPVQLKEITVTGSCGLDYSGAIELIKNRDVAVEDLVTHRFSLNSLIKAFSTGLIKERREGYIKGVVLFKKAD